MPLSTMSAASSGGVRSSAILTLSTTALIGSWSASSTSSDLISRVFGTPATRSRPFTSITCSSGVAKAVPIDTLISSAVRSPINRL